MMLWIAAVIISLCAARPVDRYSAIWATPSGPSNLPYGVPMGRPSPPDGPYAGNGDVTVMYTGNSSIQSLDGAAGSSLGWQQWLHLSKNDMWGSDSVDYYPHLSAGRVGFLIVPPMAGPTTNGTVAIFPGNASIVHSLVAATGGAVVEGATRVLENNVVAVTLACTAESGGTCAVTLLLSDTDSNYFGVAQDTGAAPDGTLVWWRKENLHNALNPAYVGSCNETVPLQSTERAFALNASSLALSLANGSCLWSDEAVSPGIITTGACAAPQGAWLWNGTSMRGDVIHTSSSACLISSRGALVLGPCGTAPWAQLPTAANSTNFYLSATDGSGCVVAVPDNNNNTLGVAVGIANAATGQLVPGTAARVSAANPSAGMTLTLSLQSGAEYILLVGLQTLRDIGCAGVRSQWEACTARPEDSASDLVLSMAATAALAAEVQTSDTFWENYWSASSVDLTSGGGAQPASLAQLTTLERWYYLSQYLLAVTTRDGKVTPALDGFVCIEPVAWGDQFTLDYNLEATFWGAGSSNRLSFIHPVMASSTNPGAVATARLRAQNSGTWGHNVNWKSSVGRTVAGAVCLPDGCPNLTLTGFKGTEWPSAGMPLGDGRLADSDLNTRFIGGLLATNLIQYWEYSRNMSTLAQLIYPFVRDNAEFYLSYAIEGPDGKLLFPYSCAQESCVCRDAAFVKVPSVPVPNFTTACTSPNGPFKDRCPDASGWELNHPCYECAPEIATGSDLGYHNAHPDIAFASSTFRNAVRFAQLLGVDSDLAAAWEAALGNMPSYPSADFTFVEDAPGSEYNGGAGYFVEAEYGHHPGVLPNTTNTTPITWPWCNKEYPIANFAAMWPTDEIGIVQTADQALLARAKQTVYALNDYTMKPWANSNGFCLSWPPAVRVSGQGDAATLIRNFAMGIASTTGNNACVQNQGGMLEDIGATVAVNDLLLQSHGGLLRFFPVWNSSVLGAASFTTLRAYGAFLVSASIDQAGTVSPVALSSEVGGDVVFESPWGGSAVPGVVNGGGAAVPVVTVSAGIYSFASDAGSAYTISSGALQA